MSKLHSTCPEAVFEENCIFLKNLINRTFLLRHWAKFFRIFCVFFSAGSSNFHSAYRGNVFSEVFISKNWFNTFVRFFGGKTLAGPWSSFCFFGVQLADSGHKTFWETCFTGVFVRFEPSVNGRLAGIVGAGLLKLHFNGSVKLSLLKFFRKTSTSAIFSWREEKYMQSFCGDFLWR